ncbi:MAG: penicillin-binding protein [Gammaproteobacteria bacterium]|nr:penicillin-binding protein [Gammaproteobacteria bacterium]|tara:strand:+ start:483 stop:1472 length:990 start_codon:yes stop_codon:yes gene_type:complete
MDTELERYLRRSPKPQFSAELFRAGVTSKFTRDCQAEIYEIGSVGKVFTTTLLAILDRQGFISINDLVSKFRSDLPFAGQVSLRQLASHTSGLPSNPVTGAKLVTESYLGMFISSFREEDFNRYLRNLRKLRSPGRFRYSNVGMALLGEILSSALGTSYESAILEHICKPLGMSDTSVAVPQTQGNLVVGHNSKGRPVEPFKWAGMEAAGVWRSTTGDMMKFLRAMLGYSGDGWRELAGVTTNPVAKVSKRMAVGLGWLTYKSERAGTLIWHDGGTLGQNAAVAWSQELDSACVLCTNQRPGLREILLPGRDIGTVALRILSGSNGKST